MKKTYIVLTIIIVALIAIVGFLVYKYSLKTPPATNQNLNISNLNIGNINAVSKTPEELAAIAKAEAVKFAEADYWANQLGAGVIEGQNNCSLSAQTASSFDANKQKNYDRNLAICKAIRQNDYKICDSLDATADVPAEFESASSAETARFSRRFQCQYAFFTQKLKDLLFNNKISDCSQGLNDCYNIQSGLSKDDTTRFCDFSCKMLVAKQVSVCDEISYLHYPCLAFVKDDIKVCEQLTVPGLAASDAGYKARVVLDCNNGFYLYKYLASHETKYLDSITLGFDQQMFNDKFANSSCEELALNPIKTACDLFNTNLQKAMQSIDCNSIVTLEYQQKCEIYKNFK